MMISGGEYEGSMVLCGDLWLMEEDWRVPVGVSRRWREVVTWCFGDGEVGGDGMKKVGGGRRDG